MLKIKKFIFLGVMMLTQLVVFGQNNTSSPYTRLGYGDLADRSFGAGRAMGGVGIGLRSPKQINPMNPASYSCMDSLTFIFDFGASFQSARYSDGANKYKNLNGNIEYLAVQFPITRWLAMSAGLLPYSFVGYKFGQVLEENGLQYTNTYSGSGGLNQVYGGLSIDIWKKRLAVGANFGFLFGNIEHYQNLYFSENTSYVNQRTQRLEVRDMKMDFGVQYTHPISAIENLTFGATFSPSNKLNAKAYDVMKKTSKAGAVIETATDTLKNVAYDLPNSFGFGASYTKTNHIRVAADFLYETWSKANYGKTTGDFQNRYRIALGAEYEPDYGAKNFFKRVHYRAGVHFGDSYVKAKSALDNKSYGYKEYGVSVGLGLPMIDYRSLVNVAFEYVKVKPGHVSMIDEQYFRVTLNYTFNERWFFKFKLD